MLAVIVQEPGEPDGLRVTEVPDAVAGPGEVLIRVAAAGLNRADLMQRRGLYPPPPGASDILGLECSGEVAALGDGVTGLQVGDRVCALLAGGGYAQLVAVPAEQVLPVPAGVAVTDAAALPEVTCTVWSNAVVLARLSAGEVLLAHGGASGIGTMAIQVGKALGATVAVTASRPAALQACADLGADLLVNYREQDFVQVLQDATGGADVIVDLLGAKYLARNISALRDGGRIVVVGMQGGTTAELNLSHLMAKRGSVASTALRSRPVRGRGGKADIVAAVRADLWPLIEAGRVRPVIDRVFPLAEVADAHRAMETGGHIGKILLAIPD
jgi:putative PIG3 family NAD(P)H quinone oxidoreductase